MISIFKLTPLIFFCLSAQTIDAMAENGEHAKLVFGEDVAIEVPRNWKFSNDGIAKLIGSKSGAMIRLGAVQVAEGKDTEIVSANAYTDLKRPSATLLLTARHSGRVKTYTQDDMLYIKDLPEHQLKTVFHSPEESLKKAYLAMDGVTEVKVMQARVDSNTTTICMFTEHEVTTADRLTFVAETWICPDRNRIFKLAMTYNKAEAKRFKSIVSDIWNSLQIYGVVQPTVLGF